MLKSLKTMVMNAVSSFNGDSLFASVGEKPLQEEIKLEQKYFYGFLVHKDTELYDDLFCTFMPVELARLSCDDLLNLGKDFFRRDLHTEDGDISMFAIFGAPLSSQEVIVNETTGEVTFDVKPETIELFNRVVASFPIYLKYSMEDRESEGVGESGVVGGLFKNS